MKDSECPVFFFLRYIPSLMQTEILLIPGSLIMLGNAGWSRGSDYQDLRAWGPCYFIQQTVCSQTQHPVWSKQVTWLQEGQSGLMRFIPGKWFVLSGEPWDCKANRWILLTCSESWIKPHLKPQGCSVMWVNIFPLCKPIRLGFDVFVSNFGGLPELNSFKQMF